MTTQHGSLSEYLRESGCTQADFAARVGVTQALISRIVRGARVPSLPLAVRIAAAANIPIESLLPPAQSIQAAPADVPEQEVA